MAEAQELLRNLCGTSNSQSEFTVSQSVSAKNLRSRTTYIMHDYLRRFCC